MKKIQTEAWIHGTGWQLLEDRGEGWEWMKEGKGISQTVHRHNPQTQTTAWRWPEGRGSRTWLEGGKGEGKRDVCNSVNNKNKVKNKCQV